MHNDRRLIEDYLLIRIQNPAKKLDHVRREIVSIRFFEILAGAIESHG
jgi:hypothetical protein